MFVGQDWQLEPGGDWPSFSNAVTVLLGFGCIASYLVIARYGQALCESFCCHSLLAFG